VHRNQECRSASEFTHPMHPKKSTSTWSLDLSGRTWRTIESARPHRSQMNPFTPTSVS
jgi:hypothetical protein